MQEHIQKRVLEICAYILKTREPVRKAAQVFEISKSTVHKDLTERLPSLDKEMALEVKKVLDFNKSERHLRGGEATRRRYKNLA